MSYTVSYDLPGYPRQHERGFARVEDAEARGNALAEQGIATGISVSEGEEQATEVPPPSGSTMIAATSMTADRWRVGLSAELAQRRRDLDQTARELRAALVTLAEAPAPEGDERDAQQERQCAVVSHYGKGFQIAAALVQITKDQRRGHGGAACGSARRGRRLKQPVYLCDALADPAHHGYGH